MKNLKMQWKLLDDSTPEELQAEINAHLADGWTLEGSAPRSAPEAAMDECGYSPRLKKKYSVVDQAKGETALSRRWFENPLHALDAAGICVEKRNGIFTATREESNVLLACGP